MAVDEVHQPVRQVGREVRAEVGGAVLAQAARDVDARVLLVGELDVGVGLVVAQQDVEARLVLLDEVVFERQRFFFVVDQDVVDVARLGDAGVPVLASARRVFGEVAADAVAQALGLADVDAPCPPASLYRYTPGARGSCAAFSRRSIEKGSYNLIVSRLAVGCLLALGFWRCRPPRKPARAGAGTARRRRVASRRRSTPSIPCRPPKKSRSATSTSRRAATARPRSASAKPPSGMPALPRRGCGWARPRRS